MPAVKEVCNRCHRAEPEPGKRACLPCLLNDAERKRVLREDLKAQGLCQFCRLKKVEKPGEHYYCPDCIADANERTRRIKEIVRTKTRERKARLELKRQASIKRLEKGLA